MSEGDRELVAFLAEKVMGYKWQATGPSLKYRFLVAPDDPIAHKQYPCTRPESLSGNGEPDYDPLCRVPDLLGRDCLLVATALQGKPYEVCVDITFHPAEGDRPARCNAMIMGDGIAIPYITQENADTPGHALGCAAKQALGGAE